MEWIGSPVAAESQKKYYDAVRINDEQVCVKKLE